jgi:thiosulfate/3-mercaptopyruvate sulfurtransferase
MTAPTNPFLAETGWLAENLGEPSLRIFDCTVFLGPPTQGRTGYSVEPGRAKWAESHIPGSSFADIARDLSDPEQGLRFMLPSASQFAEAMSRYGVGEGTQVILYDSALNMWAARVWWMLRVFGFDNARVLSGGMRKWRAEGHPLGTGDEPPYPPATFVARTRPGLMATKDEVLAAIDDGATCIIDALGEDQYAGRTRTYGRPGHIPTAGNVPAMGIIDPQTHAYLPIEIIREKFAGAGADPAKRIITYCGGGIAASSDAFALTMLGYDNVAVYDASLSEWAADPDLPLEVTQ